MYDDGVPLSIVFDSTKEAKSVKKTPKTIVPKRAAPDNAEPQIPFTVTKNIEIIAIIVGNLPLQGMKAFVRTAIRRSLGESITRQPVTPQALQPSPIIIVIACFPHAPEHLKQRSRLNAIRGKYPKSSRSVKSGKKIAIGGSITETTHASTL